MTKSVSKIETAYYELRTQCLDQKGEIKTRYLGNVRGMTDNGQPGWTEYGSMQLTLEEARQYAKFAPNFSVYDGHYKDAPVEIIYVTKVSTIEVNKEIVS